MFAANVERFQRGYLADVAGLPHGVLQKLPCANHAGIFAVRRLLFEHFPILLELGYEQLAGLFRLLFEKYLCLFRLPIELVYADKEPSHGKPGNYRCLDPAPPEGAPAVFLFVAQSPHAFSGRILLSVAKGVGAVPQRPVGIERDAGLGGFVARHCASPHACAGHLAATRRSCHGKTSLRRHALPDTTHCAKSICRYSVRGP